MAGEGTYSLADIGALMNNRHDGFDDKDYSGKYAKEKWYAKKRA